MIYNVAALYVDARGPYPGLVAEWYDADRDARTYPGTLPVVAHPPCGPWGRYHHVSHQDPSLAWDALAKVRAFGGVLEHPTSSRFFNVAGLPTVDGQLDFYGGFTLRVRQWDWGHPAEKATRLYIVGCEPIPPLPPARLGTPTPLENLAKSKRHLTPPAFARWLCTLTERQR